MVKSKVGPVVSKPGWATWRRHGLALVSPRRLRNWWRLVLARCFPEQFPRKRGYCCEGGGMRIGFPVIASKVIVISMVHVNGRASNALAD